jgi:hypothetical protein
MADNTRPTEITIGTDKYYNADDLSKYDPSYFFGCSRTVRNIIARKNIESNNYAYATWNKKTNWVISANQEKPATKASLLLSSKWVTENIPKMMPTSNESKELLYEYPEAPNIIILNDEEKFRDNENKTVEIETRGKKTPKGIYFLASDVSNVFEMPNLIKTLKKEDRGYTENIHYNIFYTGDPNKKHIYITYIGLLKIIFSSRHPNTKYNELFLVSWLQNIVKIKEFPDELCFVNLHQEINLRGIVYLVTCDILNGVKIGFWRSSLITLKQRYTTSYGSNIKILFCRTNIAPTLEKQIHDTFNHYNLSNEIFRKDKLDEYLEYIKNVKGLNIYDYDELDEEEILYFMPSYIK